MNWTEATVADLANLEGAYIIDVRESSEYTEGHIPNAVNVPLSGLTESFEFIDTQDVVYVVCQVGGRSARACEFLSQQTRFDNSQFINVLGGTAAWIIEGNEVVSGDQPA